MDYFEEQAKYWHASAAEAWTTAQLLRRGKRNSDALFFCQLTLEKLLKGLVALETQAAVPYIHDLVRLARLARLDVTGEHERMLSTISGFNLKARYDDVKASFRKQATPAYTSQFIHATDALRLWLQKKYPSGYND